MKEDDSNMGKIVVVVMLLAAFALIAGCSTINSTDRAEQAKQERLSAEASKQVSIPNIINFREKKLMKTILELRDQEGLVTYTYIFNELKGQLIYLGESVGYGLPYATQFVNPQKLDRAYVGGEWHVLPQADPNGVFIPESAEGTWILLKDPESDEVAPVYIEPRIITSPFLFPESIAIYP